MDRSKFKDIDLNDPFFDTLKSDYKEFRGWFLKKAEEEAFFILYDGELQGFLYLKIETGSLDDVSPSRESTIRLKIGTLKVNPHGTRLGERFIKKALDAALLNNCSEVYTTIFEKHHGLIELLENYGFRKQGTKTTSSGTEQVLLKKMGFLTGNQIKDYPYIDSKSRKFLLSIYPVWHTRLFPDSILKTEDPKKILEDISHTNSIHKVYLTRMRGTNTLERGDTLLIYRTSDNAGPAHFRSVVTSVCMVEEVKSIYNFSTAETFLDYTLDYSVFTEEELREQFRIKKYHTIIKFTYNYALPRRPTRGWMLEHVGMDGDQYFGFLQLSDEQFYAIFKEGKGNESLIVN